MRPFIHGNKDTLLLIPVSTLSKGDIVLAHIDGKRYVVHRIVELNENTFTLMGDGNLYEKETCSRSDIYGVVGSIIRDGEERSLISKKVHMQARMWRLLLPLRRLKAKISYKINHI